MHQHHGKTGFIYSQGLQGRLYPGNIAMVVRTPDINHPVKTPVMFILVISDIGSKIGLHAIAADDNPVFLVSHPA